MKGSVHPSLVVAGLLAAMVAAAGWSSLRSTSVAAVEASLHERDPYAQFVDREAPDFTLTDARGDRVALDDFRGKPVILNFIYARCTDTCPPHMAVVADLQDRMRTLGVNDEVEFVTLATDTEDAAETAAAIRDYGERFALEPSNWHMLYRGDRSPRAVIALASGYGLEFRVNHASDGHDHAHEPSSQTHGAVIHVIDPSGRLRARFHGLEFGPETLTTYVQALLGREWNT